MDSELIKRDCELMSKILEFIMTYLPQMSQRIWLPKALRIGIPVILVQLHKVENPTSGSRICVGLRAPDIMELAASHSN